MGAVWSEPIDLLLHARPCAVRLDRIHSLAYRERSAAAVNQLLDLGHLPVLPIFPVFSRDCTMASSDGSVSSDSSSEASFLSEAASSEI